MLEFPSCEGDSGRWDYCSGSTFEASNGVSMRGQMLGFHYARLILGGEIIWAAALLKLSMGSV